jgi:hypothetical protein
VSSVDETWYAYQPPYITRSAVRPPLRSTGIQSKELVGWGKKMAHNVVDAARLATYASICVGLYGSDPDELKFSNVYVEV